MEQAATKGKRKQKLLVVAGVIAGVIALAVIGSFLPDQREVALVNASGERRVVQIGNEQVDLAPRSVETVTLNAGSHELKVTGEGGFARTATLVLAKQTGGPVVWLDVDGRWNYALVNADLLYERTFLGVKLGSAGSGKLVRHLYRGSDGFQVELPSSSAKLVGPFEALPESVSKDTQVLKLVPVAAQLAGSDEILEAVVEALGD